MFIPSLLNLKRRAIAAETLCQTEEYAEAKLWSCTEEAIAVAIVCAVRFC
ncbi:hypothetical protein [[Leptolyngbya] sp. PCC 7376]|nr:hypothetical protein [[Leptolyngbya] sp. PCC 7376]